MESEGRIPDRCLKCDFNHIVRYGRTPKGTIRYRCKNCGKTFTGLGVISRSRQTEEQWMRFAECYVDGDSLERSARICGVSKSTVRRMRSALDELKCRALGMDMEEYEFRLENP